MLVELRPPVAVLACLPCVLILFTNIGNQLGIPCAVISGTTAATLGAVFIPPVKAAAMPPPNTPKKPRRDIFNFGTLGLSAILFFSKK